MEYKFKLPFLISLFLSISLVSSFDEIEYVYNKGFLGRMISHFLVRFNKETGIYAEFQRYNAFPVKNGTVKSNNKLETYNIPNELLNILPNKELFEKLNKIQFPENEDCSNHKLYDVPFWRLNVNGKSYYGNVGADFMTEFTELVKLNEIRDYVLNKYDNKS